MVTNLNALAHKHTFGASRTIPRQDSDLGLGVAQRELSQQLAEFIQKRKMHVAVDGESTTYKIELVVLTLEDLHKLVEEAVCNPVQGELQYVGNDAQTG